MVSSEPIEPSTYSRNVYGALPEMGRVLGTGQRRALLGWTHKKDTATGLRKGQIWCWVSTANKLQVYDTKGNRANFRGPRVDCGVANFSMVRMFHPYWCDELPGGRRKIPQDMISEDKRRLRELYRELVAQSLQDYQDNLNSDGEEDDDGDDDDDTRRDREEARVLYKADRRGMRRNQAWKNRMGARYHLHQVDQWRRERTEAENQPARRQRQRTTAARVTGRPSTARGSNLRNSRRRDSRASSSISQGPSRPRHNPRPRPRHDRLGSETYDRIQGMFKPPAKTNTPGSALHDDTHVSHFLESSDDEDVGDIQHDDYGGQDQQEMLHIFEQNAAQEVTADLPEDLNSGSSNRATNSLEIINDNDDPNNQSMFFSDVASNLEGRSQRSLSEGPSTPSGSQSAGEAGPRESTATRAPLELGPPARSAQSSQKKSRPRLDPHRLTLTTMTTTMTTRS